MLTLKPQFDLEYEGQGQKSDTYLAQDKLSSNDKEVFIYALQTKKYKMFQF
jgi:hypothetical protein